MSKSLHTLVFSAAFILLGASSLAYSQVYSWVDENGKRHYGDRIPPQYQDQADEYKISKPNSSDAVKPQARPQPKTSTNPYSYDYKPVAKMPTSQSKHSNPNSCEAKKEAYRKAQNCWAACRQYTGGGGSRINASGAACRGCSNMKKPKC